MNGFQAYRGPYVLKYIDEIAAWKPEHDDWLKQRIWPAFGEETFEYLLPNYLCLVLAEMREVAAVWP